MIINHTGSVHCARYMEPPHGAASEASGASDWRSLLEIHRTHGNAIMVCTPFELFPDAGALHNDGQR